MRVLLLADPSSAHTMRWARSLSRAGTEVAIVGLSAVDDAVYRSFDVHVHSLSVPRSVVARDTGVISKMGYIMKLPRARAALRRFKPDIMHAHYATSYGLMGSLLQFHPFVLSVWGTDVFDFPRRSLFHRSVLKYNLHKADRILATSRIMASEIGRYTKKAVEVTPFGIDLERFRPLEPRTGLFGKNDIVIGTIKRLEPIYGIDQLIRAFRLLKDRLPALPLRLLIVGGGSQEQSLRSLARQLGVENDTAFTGEVAPDETPKYHNMISVFAALSLEESFGVALLEASACGRPIVATRVGGIPEVVDHERTGLLVPPGDANSAADALELLVRDPAMRSMMGKEGRRFVQHHYDWTGNVNQMLEIYRQVNGSSAAHSASQ